MSDENEIGIWQSSERTKSERMIDAHFEAKRALTKDAPVSADRIAMLIAENASLDGGALNISYLAVKIAEDTVQAAMGPAVTVPLDLVKELWTVVKSRRDALFFEEGAHKRMDDLLGRMKGAGMAEWIPSLDEIIADGPYVRVGWDETLEQASERANAKVTADHVPETPGGSLEHHTLSPADLEIQRLRKALEKHARQCELLASAMRDTNRTGNWSGAEKVAQAFDRQALNARKTIAREALERKP